MTYSDICKKLGFDPVVDGYNYKYSGHEDDSQVSPFHILTEEESDFLLGYMIAHRKEMKSEPKKKRHCASVWCFFYAYQCALPAS